MKYRKGDTVRINDVFEVSATHPFAQVPNSVTLFDRKTNRCFTVPEWAITKLINPPLPEEIGSIIQSVGSPGLVAVRTGRHVWSVTGNMLYQNNREVKGLLGDFRVLGIPTTKESEKK